MNGAYFSARAMVNERKLFDRVNDRRLTGAGKGKMSVLLTPLLCIGEGFDINCVGVCVTFMFF